MVKNNKNTTYCESKKYLKKFEIFLKIGVDISVCFIYNSRALLTNQDNLTEQEQQASADEKTFLDN